MTQMYSEFLTRMTGNDPAFESGEITEETIGDTKYMLYFLDVGQNRPGHVQNVLLYCPIHDTSVILNEVSRLVLMIMGAMAGVSIVLFWFVAGSISTPVSRLCEAARGIGEKKFKKVETGTNVKELYELENEINQMQDNLLKADEAERVFFQNASHELRTPLMSISGYAQGIQRGVFEDVSQAAGVILDESSRLTEVVDGILTLTRMDQMRYQVVPVELGIREYIEDQIERLEGLAYQKKIKLEFLPGDEHKIISDVMLLGRAFSNVTSNCIRYAKEMVWISVEENGEQLKITIRDDGPGILEDDLPHLFDRFYKGKNGNHGLDPALIFVEELGKAGGHFAAAGAGGGDYHQRAGGFDVFILTKALIADDERDIGGIIGDDIVAVDLDPQGLQALLEGIGGWLGMVMGDADAAHIQADPTEGIDEAQDIQIVGDTQIAAALVLFDGISADDNDDLRGVLHLQQHFHLAIRRKPRQHAGSVVIIKELTAEFQVQLTAKLTDALPDLIRLHLQVFFIIKADFEHDFLLVLSSVTAFL